MVKNISYIKAAVKACCSVNHNIELPTMLPLRLLGFLIMLGRLLVIPSGSGKRQELVVYQMHKNKKLASPDSDNPLADFKIQTLGTVKRGSVSLLLEYF